MFRLLDCKRPLLLAGLTLIAGTACSIGSLGSIYSQFSFISLFPGQQGPPGPDGAQGPPGPQGPAGAGSQSLVYGDGSAGARVIDTSGLHFTDTNLQYTDFTIVPGISVFFPSGVIIRCTGTFTNNGSIFVEQGAEGVQRDTFGGADVVTPAPEAGVSRLGSTFGELGDNSADRLGGHAGVGLGTDASRYVLSPGVKAGGAGTGTFGAPGGDGGGSFTVLAKTAIVNAAGAEIDARGGANLASGCAGGGGGIIILASPGSVTNNGSIDCRGGPGAPSGSSIAAGGGGGGGIVHILSPSIPGNGPINVTGGVGGQASGTIMAALRSGGGGGGACAGNGGSGGDVSTTGVPGDGFSGSNGEKFFDFLDPTALF